MIATIAKVRGHIVTTAGDEVLAQKLTAIESAIRAYTRNTFQARAYRCVADVRNGTFYARTRPLFGEGDTVQVSGAEGQNGLFTVDYVDDMGFTVRESVTGDADGVTVTRVIYPEDVQLGAIHLLKWDLENRDKAGIASESISRHSVTYADMTGANTIMGYPASLMGFLKPYMCARF